MPTRRPIMAYALDPVSVGCGPSTWFSYVLMLGIGDDLHQLQTNLFVVDHREALLIQRDSNGTDECDFVRHDALIERGLSLVAEAVELHTRTELTDDRDVCLQRAVGEQTEQSADALQDAA